MEIIDFTALSLADRMGYIAKLNTKVLNVSSGMDRVAKNGENQKHQYKYATEADVINEVRPLLKEQKLLVKPSVLNAETIEGKTVYERSTYISRVDMIFALIDVETGYIEYSYFTGMAMDIGDKGIYKAYTGCHKYFLMKTFNIETGDDIEKDDDQSYVMPDGVKVISHGQAPPKIDNKSSNNTGEKKPEGVKKQYKATPPRGTTGTAKVVSGKVVVEIEKLINDYLTLDPSGTREAIINKLKERESIGEFEKVESLTVMQGEMVRDQLRMWYNRKQEDLSKKIKAEEQQQEQVEEQQPEPPEETKKDDDRPKDYDPFAPRAS